MCVNISQNLQHETSRPSRIVKGHVRSFSILEVYTEVEQRFLSAILMSGCWQTAAWERTGLKAGATSNPGGVRSRPAAPSNPAPRTSVPQNHGASESQPVSDTETEDGPQSRNGFAHVDFRLPLLAVDENDWRFTKTCAVPFQVPVDFFEE